MSDCVPAKAFAGDDKVHDLRRAVADLEPHDVAQALLVRQIGRPAVVALRQQAAQSLSVLTLFMLAVLLGRLRHLPSCCPFRVSWWAVSFPLATDAIALALLALATPTIAGLLVRTLVGIARGELRTLSG